MRLSVKKKIRLATGVTIGKVEQTSDGIDLFLERRKADDVEKKTLDELIAAGVI